MSLVTASGLERAAACPASCVLPQARSSGDYAEDGQARHEHVRRLLVGMPRDESLRLVPPALRAQCEVVQYGDLVGDLAGRVRGEVAYAVNVDTGEARELGVALGRSYPKIGPREVCGTLDIEGVLPDGSWSVADLKSGYLDVTPAPANFQLLFFAFVLSFLHGKSVEGKILRLRADGSARAETRATYDAFALDSFGDTLIEIVDGVARVKAAYDAGERFAVSEGEWCRYCSAFNSCPAKQQLARSMLPDLESIDASLASLAAEDAGRAWLKMKQIEPVFERVKKALKERAAREPLPTTPGKAVREIEFQRSDFSGPAAVALLRAKGASQEEIEALSVEHTVRQIREGKTETKSTKRASASRSERDRALAIEGQDADPYHLPPSAVVDVHAAPPQLAPVDAIHCYLCLKPVPRMLAMAAYGANGERLFRHSGCRPTAVAAKPASAPIDDGIPFA